MVAAKLVTRQAAQRANVGFRNERACVSMGRVVQAFQMGGRHQQEVLGAFEDDGWPPTH